MDKVKKNDRDDETYQVVVDRLLNVENKTIPEAKKNARIARRLLWMCRMANWPPDTTLASLCNATAFFDNNKPATFGLKKGSYAVYQSEALSVLKPDPVRKNRYILQMTGTWREVHDLTVATNMPPEFRWRCSPLLWFLDERGLRPNEVTHEILMSYYEFSLNTELLAEDRARQRAKDAARYITTISALPAFAKFGFNAVDIQFRNRSIKYDVPANIAEPLLKIYDSQVAPWARGEISNTGLTHEAYLKQLDDTAAAGPATTKKRMWKSGKEFQQGRIGGRKSRAGTAQGFLTTSKRWQESTIGSRRELITICVKALYEAEGFKIETLEELTDPEIIEACGAIFEARQAGKKHSSKYIDTILDVIGSLARHFVMRSQEDLDEISEIRSYYTVERRGIAPRNREKLQNFTPARIQALIDMPDLMIRDINREVNRRRNAYRATDGVLPRPEEVYDTKLIREVVLVLAHHIMMARAPRRENLCGIKLNWIRWRDERATIEIPATQVKSRKEVDGPLPIPLDAVASRLLKSYLEKLRAKILHPEDPRNPYLFPSMPHAGKQRIGASYKTLPDKLVRRIHTIVGVSIHPHLSRHLLGWIWLREDPDKLPAVQILLGHKNLQTTIDYYAEIDETVALTKWQEFLNARKT